MSSLRTIHRTIAAVLIYDCDGYLLMGWKDNRGATYPESWSLPGGGQEKNESIKDAAVREVFEETGLIIQAKQLKVVKKGAQTGEALRTLASGECVNCLMDAYRFKVHLEQSRHNVSLPMEGEFAAWRWFAPDEVIYNDTAFIYVSPR